MRALSINGNTSVAVCAERGFRSSAGSHVQAEAVAATPPSNVHAAPERAAHAGIVRAILMHEITEHGVAREYGSVVLFEADSGDGDGLADDRAQAVADGLRPLYDASAGNAGFISVALAALPDDVRAVCAAARQAWQRLRRPNVLVAVPATAAGVKAVFRLTTEAINVHVTGIDSHADYGDVVAAYVAGVRHRAELGLPVAGITSFATLRVSRRAAGAAFATRRFADIRRQSFLPDTFGDLLRLGARPQLLLGHWLDDHAKPTS